MIMFLVLIALFMTGAVTWRLRLNESGGGVMHSEMTHIAIDAKPAWWHLWYVFLTYLTNPFANFQEDWNAVHAMELARYGKVSWLFSAFLWVISIIAWYSLFLWLVPRLYRDRRHMFRQCAEWEYDREEEAKTARAREIIKRGAYIPTA